MNGKQVEKLAADCLRAEGYVVHQTVHASWNPVTQSAIRQSNDIFGCIDSVAKHSEDRTRWIQVTKTSAIGAKVKKLSAIPWNREADSVEVWLWKGRPMKKVKAPPGKKMEKFRSYQYFQVRHLDDEWAINPQRDIYPDEVLGPDWRSR